MKRSWMRVATRATAGAAIALALSQAGIATARAQDAQPEFSVDVSRLPEVPQIMSKVERDRQTMMAAGVGGVLGIVVADVLTGGLLLAPLGLPTFAALVGGGGAAAPAAPAAAAAAAAPTYTLAQQVLAGVASMTAALGGGYIGVRVAGPEMPP